MKLYPHQQAALEFLDRAFADGADGVRLRSRTGEGSSITVAGFAASKAAAGERCLEIFSTPAFVNPGKLDLLWNDPNVDVGPLGSDAKIVTTSYSQIAAAMAKGTDIGKGGFAWIIFHEGYPLHRETAEAVRTVIPEAKAFEICLMPRPYPGMIDVSVDADHADPQHETGPRPSL